MVTTTTNSIEGQQIVKYKKVLTGQAFIGGKIGGLRGTNPKSISEMTPEEFDECFVEGTSAAYSKLVEQAEALGANAIIGAGAEYHFCGPNNETLFVVAKGTAVIVDISYY